MRPRNCEVVHPSSTTKEVTLMTSTIPTTTPQELKCPGNFTLYHRTPTALNNHTSAYCMKVVASRQFHSIFKAQALCKEANATLTVYENVEERKAIHEEMTAILKSYNLFHGSIAVGARRRAECNTRDLLILGEPPCNSPTTSFFTSDGHTNPTYLWTSWMQQRPTNPLFTGIEETCVSFGVSSITTSPYNNVINDLPCENKEESEGTDLWIFGALCGFPL